jgi:hypothetical protein
VGPFALGADFRLRLSDHFLSGRLGVAARLVEDVLDLEMGAIHFLLELGAQAGGLVAGLLSFLERSANIRFAPL